MRSTWQPGARYRQATLQAAVEQVKERYFGTVRIRNSTVQYGSVLYCTVRCCQKIRWDTFSPPPPPLHNPLTPVVVTAEISGEEVRCRIALRERTWRHQIRWPAADQSSKAHLLESELMLATSLERERQRSKGHYIKKFIPARPMRSAPRLVNCLDQLSKALWGNVPIVISVTSSFFFLFLPVLLILFFLLSWGKLSQSLRKGRGRSQANIREGVAKLEKEHKNTIDAMGKASDEEKDEEKERCRATLEKVWT